MASDVLVIPPLQVESVAARHRRRMPVESVEAAALIMASISLSDLMIPPKEGAVEVNADRSQKGDEWAVLRGAKIRREEKHAD